MRFLAKDRQVRLLLNSNTDRSVYMSSDKLPPPRERILGVAGTLFYREGYRAVGVDRVIAESGVAKATFYKHFPSKDDLIVAWLDRADMQVAAWAEAATKGKPEPLVALFEALLAMARLPQCLGCTFQGTAAEFPDAGHPGHIRARQSKTSMIEMLEELAEREGLADPQGVARALFLFIEGALASIRMFGQEAPVEGVVSAAKTIIDASRQKGTARFHEQH